MSLIFTCGISYAEMRFNWMEGIKASICGVLTPGACDSLSWDNHKNAINVITTGMLERVCGTRNISQIERMIQRGDLKNKECIRLYNVFKESKILLVK